MSREQEGEGELAHQGALWILMSLTWTRVRGEHEQGDTGRKHRQMGCRKEEFLILRGVSSTPWSQMRLRQEEEKHQRGLPELESSLYRSAGLCPGHVASPLSLCFLLDTMG